MYLIPSTKVEGISGLEHMWRTVGLFPTEIGGFKTNYWRTTLPTTKATVYKKIQENGVMLEGSLLKPAMVVPGVDAADKSDPTEIAQLTVRTLERCVPGAMPGVTFLSGGISEEDASIYLNEINKVPRKTQTRLTFSYSRALQSSCIKTWKGEAGNVDAAQKQLLARAQANGEASKGEYVPGSQPSDEESLFVKNYVY